MVPNIRKFYTTGVAYIHTYLHGNLFFGGVLVLMVNDMTCNGPVL